MSGRPGHTDQPVMEVLEDEQPDGFVAEPTEAEPACALSLRS